MHLQTWLLFLLTSIGMSLSPGPNALLALTHGALHGSKRTLFTIAGSLLGFVLIIAGCLFGIGALLESSAHWLTALKWLGGAYLVWLGIKLFSAPAISMDLAVSARGDAWSLFRQGLATGVTNPKGVLFFTALLPQFLDPERSLVTQFVFIAATYSATEFAVECGIAVGATRLRPWLARSGRRFNRACGAVLVAIGAGLPAH
ncbi:LysE family translocator [Ideonella sp.]|uniref:LysE family translocator n=1 Tax=Ideonella sp. TaxID=1929293 RepID=UPI0035AEB930